jgi:hypothetical protein
MRKLLIAGVLVCSLAVLHMTWGDNDDSAAHEVWMLDQSNTYDGDGDTNGTLDSGGTLYIFNGSKLAGKGAAKAPPEVIDLGGPLAEWVKQLTGTLPVRPHYITFNPSSTHAIIAFVASGHVLIIEAATRTPVFVVDVGAQAHAAVPAPDGSYILVANQNGKLLQRIDTDYATNTFALDHGKTLNLASGTTPSGALKQDDGVSQVNVRPDTAPIFAAGRHERPGVRHAPWRRLIRRQPSHHADGDRR